MKKKLSKQLPEFFSFTRSNWSTWGKWLKELAEYVEFIDRRDRLAYRDLRERLLKPPEKPELEYKPQTYDEAIALCKGWRRYPETGLARWESPSGDRVVFDFGKCSASWERCKWPDLWKEMVEDGCKGHLYLYKNRWTLNLPCRYEDSTPGRVVCQAYLVYKDHADWAKRLLGGDCD